MASQNWEGSQVAIDNLQANHLNDGQLHTYCNTSETHLLPFALLH